MEKTPQQAAGVARLKRWAADPAGGGKIMAWGTKGDYQRCLDFYRDKLPAQMLHGWCAEIHKLATGAAPGHDAGEKLADAGKGKG